MARLPLTSTISAELNLGDKPEKLLLQSTHRLKVLHVVANMQRQQFFATNITFSGENAGKVMQENNITIIATNVNSNARCLPNLT